MTDSIYPLIGATKMRARLFGVAIWSLTFFLVTGTWSAQANRITRSDAERFESLRVKVSTVVLDLGQAASSAANEHTRNCLSIIRYQGQLIAGDVGHVDDLITLASLMRDDQDQSAVLYLLYKFVHPFIESLASRSQLINQSMAVCSNVGTANVKPEALLNLLSELAVFLSAKPFSQ
jgi:hypothetical protein